MADNYYSRTEVSNSDLTELKNILHPRMQYGDKEAAFRFGSLVDAIITEPAKVDYYRLTVDDVPYTEDEFRHAQEMQKSLRMEARKDAFLDMVLKCADTQRFMVNKAQQFTYCDFPFTLDTRCKWDWWLPQCSFGGDLKTTFATSQKQFDEAVDFFDWDRSRAWYMDIARSNRDFIYGISKKNCKVFKKFIFRDDDIYNRGREKYEELAFQYWCLCPQGEYITFDVMLHDRFICTLRMPTYMAVGHKDGVRQVIQEEALMRFIEKKRPTLKGKPYNICF